MSYLYCCFLTFRREKFSRVDSDLIRRGVESSYLPLHGDGRLYRLAAQERAKLFAEGENYYLLDGELKHRIYAMPDGSVQRQFNNRESMCRHVTESDWVPIKLSKWAITAAVQIVGCPRCGAVAGMLCKLPSGVRSNTHLKRTQAYRQTIDEAEYSRRHSVTPRTLRSLLP